MNTKKFDDYLLVKVRYPECTNYEGIKIMVYEINERVKTINDVIKHNKGAIDPHFGVNPDFISPMVRFEPTDRGWKMGIEFCKNRLI
jgi:hypothetical protein